MFRQKWREMTFGELVDKYCILKTKAIMLYGTSAEDALIIQLSEIRPHLVKLWNKIAKRDDDYEKSTKLWNELYTNHLQQWNWEDAVMNEVEPEKVAYAAKMSRKFNLRRAEIKKELDIMAGEKFLEIKKYKDLKWNK